MSFSDFSSATTKSAAIGNLITKLLKSVAYVHHEHLTTTSYERHITLQQYYEGMPGVVDTLAEASIARGYPQSFAVQFNPSSFEQLLIDAMAECNSVHKILEKDEMWDLTNALEDIMTFISSVQYKLRLK